MVKQKRLNCSFFLLVQTYSKYYDLSQTVLNNTVVEGDASFLAPDSDD